MSSESIAIDVKNLSKCYEIYNTPRDRLKQLVLPHVQQMFHAASAILGASAPRAPSQYFHEFWALRDVSFQVRRGETFGIIGRNGGGKSTLLQILAGTLAHTSGEVTVDGRIAALLELGSGFNPDFTGRENVFLNGRILGLTQHEIEARYEQIVAFADIGEFIDQPVKTYSSGMFVRLAFAVQAHIDASIVIIDEALAVGDVFFRQKCYARLEELRKSGAAILLVSHAMAEIEQFCDRAILLDHGLTRFIGSSSEAAKHYYILHQKKGALVSEEESNTNRELAPMLGEAQGPPCAQDAFIDLSDKPQVSNGQARCIRVALCNVAGQACNSFRQGDVAVFYYEFELIEAVGVPICGIVIKNERGIIVHGKNAWQYDNDVPLGLNAGDRVSCRCEIAMRLAPGEYVFELSFASLTEKEWKNRASISHDELTSRYTTLCVVTNAGHFSMGLAIKNGVPILTHHGVADLPGEMITSVLQS